MVRLLIDYLINFKYFKYFNHFSSLKSLLSTSKYVRSSSAISEC